MVCLTLLLLISQYALTITLNISLGGLNSSNNRSNWSRSNNDSTNSEEENQNTEEENEASQNQPSEVNPPLLHRAPPDIPVSGS